MKQKIGSVFEALKELEMKPTPKNVAIMDGIYEVLKGIYKELEEKENAGKPDGSGRTDGPTPDISGHDNH